MPVDGGLGVDGLGGVGGANRLVAGRDGGADERVEVMMMMRQAEVSS